MNHNYHALDIPDAKGNDHKEDKNQHTLALAVAMTVAAKAAVAAANAATELARLVRSSEDLEWRTKNVAAIKIQSFYRAHLAWKALVGLRGVLKLQAVIRGQIVRRKVLNRMNNIQQFENARARVHRIRVPTFDQVSRICNDKKDHFTPHKERKDDQILESPTTIRNHRFDSQMCEMQRKLGLENKHHNSPTSRTQMSYYTKRHYHLSPDRSDDTSLPNSPIFPTYMATTESFMAKARSLSTPRQRLSFLDSCCNHSSSLATPMLSSSSSFNDGMKRNYRHMHL
ncbi:uncharacterized protein LOC112517800 [Cynara cardunculus var. scolymus]|uniref:DUF4005 domain-containing protein n=1 Tax=Cynara cardunculus var. scolymus TaxID=59895 RepID=A0A103XPJ3_CYNCS|nr:uncharacterized protein LOC112517800 [Cynara cardunculus var. scolymus]KVH94475.1 protein of unknown function DUF4005 [Cynara cardunculus var. scolymus]